MTRILRLSYCLILLGFAFVSGAAQAQTFYHVSVAGNDDTGDGSQGAPYKTVAKAIMVSTPTDVDPAVVRIAKGVYLENLILKDHMTLEGGYESVGWTRDIAANATTIKSASSDPGSITILSASPCTVDGMIVEGGFFGIRAPGVSLTVRECTFKSNSVAGISALSSADVTVENCIFDKPVNGINVASSSSLSVTDSTFATCGQYGIFSDNAQLIVERSHFDSCGQDGLYLRNSDAVIRRVISAHNIRHGLRMQTCTGLVENSIFGDNDYGINLQTSGDVPVYFCTLAGNRVTAFICDKSTPDLRNNIFSGSGNYGLEERTGTIGPSRLTTNCFHGNGSADYLDGGTTPTLGAAAINSSLINGSGLVHSNIDGDPKVLKPAHDSFYLGIGSSCLDAAEPIAGIDVDVFGDPRPYDFPQHDGNGADPDADIGAIEFRGVTHYDFARGDTGWALTTVPFFFNPPDGWAIPDKLMIRSNDTLTFGFWTSPFDRIPALPGKIYMVEFLISTNVKKRDLVPTFRLRALNESGQISNTFGVNSSGMGDSSPVSGDQAVYRMYFNPLQGGIANEDLSQIILGFDIMQFDINDQLVSTFYIEDVQITEMDKSSFLAGFNDISSADFTSGANGWQPLPSLPPPVTAPQAMATSRGLELKAQDNLFCFGSWYGPPVNSVGMQVVHMKGVFGSDASSMKTAPTFRMRINSLNNQTFCDLACTSVAEGEASPANGSEFEYEVFFEAPAVSMDAELLPVFDILNFDPNDDSTPTVWLKSLEIKGLPRP